MFFLEALLDGVSLNQHTLGLEHAFNKFFPDLFTIGRHYKL
jgi:hypothetical protein